MAAKPPKPFRKPLSEKKFTKRITRRIYLEPDKKFLSEITRQDADGNIVLSRELTDKEAKRLSKLVKAAKKSKGAVRTGKLVILGVLAGGVLLFNLLFRNMIAERVTEQLLERLFQARSDVVGMEFRPLAGSLSFSSLTIADRERPDSNLIELGTGRFQIDVWQAVQGTILIEDLTVAGLAFGTQRSEPGTLDGNAPEARSEQDSAEFDPLETLGLPESLDAEEFLRENLDLLETPQLADEIVQDATGLADNAGNRFGALSAEGETLLTEVQEFAGTDFSTVASVEEALRLVEEATSLVDRTSGALETVNREVTSTRAEIESLLLRIDEISVSVGDDIDRVLAQIPDVQVEGPAFLQGLIDPLARNLIGSWYDRILTALGYFEQLQELRGEDERPENRRGTVVTFPTIRYPLFLLEEGFFSSTGARDTEARITGLSCDQNVNGSPTLITYSDRMGARDTTLGATVDLRDEAELLFALEFTSANVPVDITDLFTSLGFERFTGSADLALQLTSGPQTDASVRILVDEPRLSGGDEQNRIGLFVQQVIETAGRVELELGVRIEESGAIALTRTTTNLSEAFGDAIQGEIDATLAELQSRLDEEIRALLAGELAAVSAQLDTLTGVENSALTLLSDATQTQRLAEAALERANAQAREFADQIRQEVESAAEEAVEEAQEQAEEAIENEVERIRDRLPLPGF